MRLKKLVLVFATSASCVWNLCDCYAANISTTYRFSGGILGFGEGDSGNTIGGSLAGAIRVSFDDAGAAWISDFTARATNLVPELWQGPSPVPPEHRVAVLARMLEGTDLRPMFFGTHSRLVGTIQRDDVYKFLNYETINQFYPNEVWQSSLTLDFRIVNHLDGELFYADDGPSFYFYANLVETPEPSAFYLLVAGSVVGIVTRLRSLLSSSFGQQA